MNDVKLFRMAKKFEALIDFTIKLQRTDLIRKIKHTGSNKLYAGVRNSYTTNIPNQIRITYAKKTICSISHNNIYQPNGRKVNINNEVFEIRKYDNDELFNISTVHPLYVIHTLKLYSMINTQGRSLEIHTLDWNLICEATAAITTQYKKFDRSLFAICTF